MIDYSQQRDCKYADTGNVMMLLFIKEIISQEVIQIVKTNNHHFALSKLPLCIDE